MPIASIGVGPTLLGIVPKAKHNVWLGYQSAVVAILRAGCGPILVLPGFLTNETGQGGSDQYPRGFFMQLNFAFALLSAVPYYLLTSRYPAPKPKVVVPAQEQEAIEACL